MLRFLPNLSQKAIRRCAIFAMALCACLVLVLSAHWLIYHHTYYKIRYHNQQTFYSLTLWRGKIYLTREVQKLSLVIWRSNGSSALSSSYAPIKPAPGWTLTRESRTFSYMSFSHTIDNVPPWAWGSSTSPQPAWGLFDASHQNRPQLMTGSGIIIPIYFLQILLLLIALFFFRLYRKNRWPLTHCQSCGFNLSGNPSAVACPECGKPTPNPKIHT